MTDGLDTGTYEVLRDRLVARAGELGARAEALNARRTEEFGSTRLALDGSAQLRTAHPAVPCDVVAVGPYLLFGRAPAPGLPREAGRETGPEDVFSLHDGELDPLPYDTVPGLLDDADFRREFAALHRYYRDATLLRLRRTEGKLLAVFRTGEKPGDVRVLRWALDGDGDGDGTGARFLDARGERDHVLPPPHDVTWTATSRADHVLGRHPHVAVGEGLFVSTVGGALTLKTEDDTETGEGVWSEPVAEPLQSLADADIAYARAGALTLLRVLPYKEEHARYLAVSRLTGTVVRLDGIGQGCRRLPEDQGVVFPGGYCLADGTAKTFDAVATDGLEYERTVRAPNGEDVLHAFHAQAAGRALLLSYNTIRKEFAAPLSCRGYALFDDGTLRVLRAESGTGEPARVHPLQTWTSPYATDAWAAARPAGSGPLARIGNADLVRGIADCLTVARTATETAPTAEVYQELLALCARTADSHPWLGEPETGDLRAPLEEVRGTAGQVLAEFETVRELARQAADALDEGAARLASVVRGLRGQAPRTAVGWVDGLAALRQAHGHLLTLKEMRYADADRIDALAADAEAELSAFGQRAVTHLAEEESFAAYHADVEELVAEAGALTTAAEAGPVTERIDDLAAGLRTVTDVVSALDTGDATVRTAVLEHVAAVLGAVNRARATLEARRRALLAEEGRAEFAAEFTLLGQAVAGALAAADTPEACDEELARLLVRVENLESRFAEDETCLSELDAKRAEIHELLSARKQSLADARARRAEQRATAAGRVLRTLARRARELPDGDAVSAFFASDPMVAKVRRTAEELRELDEPGRAQELDDRLAALRQEAARALRDRDDLYSDGGRTVRLGRHRFAVNTQPLDLTLVPHGDGLAFALSGTDYRAPVTDPDFLATRPYWDRAVPSESPAVYRAEHLAARLLAEHGAEALAAADDLGALVRQAARDAYDEGHERGVHDHDAALILAALLRLRESAGPLCHEPDARATAQLFWAHRTTAGQRTAWTRRAVSLARARDAFGAHEAVAELKAELAGALAESSAESSADPEETGSAPFAAAAAYLFDELTSAPEGFVLSAATRTLLDKFRRTADAEAYESDLGALDRLADRRQLAEAWLGSYARAAGEPLAPGDLAEAVAAELCPDLPRYALEAPVAERITGLLGAHPRVEGGALTLRIDEFLARTEDFRTRDVPGFRAYQRERTALVTAERDGLRLEDHRPRALSSFVRGRLVDEVYLPLVGDSLARQMGTADESGTGGAGGLLLLVSPPGYGKTTLMEYVAERLGLVLVKVSGPALGHAVTSLDPAEAPNAMARQEVEKINFALEAGTNTLLYLDDIQHTSPELLQRFIPLCDATRRVEGVWNGRARTYDLRGKRFAVCMAGNPYTGDGSRFQIPDMLANRADVWNLGDVLTGKEHLFALSFVENALTSHPLLAPLAGRTRDDLGVLVRLAEQDPTARADQLTRPYPAAELAQVLAVLRHLLAARTTVLDVNRAYLASAAQSDATRTEPPFRLQGSYRDMNKIVRRVQPVMNDAELHALVTDHYATEAQTLTSGAEANLLKLAELRGTLTPEQATRWTEVKRTHVRAQALGGDEADPVARAVGALGLLADRIAAVETAITRAKA
ncbi:DNA repair ATPase [Streptomyces sp. NPDC048172]|uniref:DNA repair ATPase n=1 Tax=Streptomyces sp. NPDC048172 TaxID=3365505 RepID=UPI00371CE29C